MSDVDLIAAQAAAIDRLTEQLGNATARMARAEKAVEHLRREHKDRTGRRTNMGLHDAWQKQRQLTMSWQRSHDLQRDRALRAEAWLATAQRVITELEQRE